MNRRNFLKSVGIVGVLGISNISFAKKELKWTKMEDKLPKMGQDIILLTYTSPEFLKLLPESDRHKYLDYQCIYSGKRIKNQFRGDKYCNFEINYLCTNRLWHKEYNSLKLMYNELYIISKEIEKIKRLPWVKENSTECFSEDFSRELSWEIPSRNRNMYWIPADKYYSGKLPEFPKPIY